MARRLWTRTHRVVDARGRAGNNHRSPTKPVFRRAFYCGLMMSDMGMGGMMHHHGMGPMKPAPAAPAETCYQAHRRRRC